MTLLKTIGIWSLAVVLALVALYRWRRGKRAILDGRWSPRLIRAVAVLLVTLGAGRDAAEAGEPEDLCKTPATSLATTGQPAIGKPPAKAPASIRATGKPLDVTPASALPPTVRAGARAIGQRSLARRRGGSMWQRFVRDLAAIDAARTPEAEKAAYDGALAKLNGAMLHHDGLPTVQKWMARELPRMRQDGALISLADLRGLIDAAEADNLYTSALVGWVWRRAVVVAGQETLTATQSKTLIDLYARLQRHARVETARTLGLIAVGPIKIRPWMSKAARPTGYRSALLPGNFANELEKAWRGADAGPWDREATLRLVVVSAPKTAMLHRQGQKVAVEPSRPVDLRRLDVIEVPSTAKKPLVLNHPRLGTLTVAPGRSLTSQNVPRLLDAATKAKVDAWAVAAGRCERDAQLKVQAILPAAAPSLRRALVKDPKGAPALRMILQVYED